MADQQQLEVLKQGVEAWNRWSKRNPGVEVDLSSALLSWTHLEGVDLNEAHLEGANLFGVNLKGANLMWAHLERADLSSAHLEGADLSGAHLEGAVLNEAHLEGADLLGANLKGAMLYKAHLENDSLQVTHLEGANLLGAHLEGANLSGAFFDTATHLGEVTFTSKHHGSILVADVGWGGVNLAAVDWASVNRLGDEQEARQAKRKDGSKKTKAGRLNEYRAAVRANRQLAVVLREQGLNEEADHFAYRAQCLQRIVWRRQRRWLRYVFSWFLSVLAGYGYRPLRSIAAYVLLILGFAVAFYTLGHLAWYEALVVSLTAFHGRGFFPQQYQPGDPQSIIAAVEAVVGLFIEISLIATLTQRFFGR